jgi:bifunctional UDP-N-acetylglucosamine pyrophosphorylase/glucosamine-1-phosphate N-acetyltransferase
VVVGKNATVAAGSVINMDIADGELGVARGKQRNVSSWKRPVKKQD